MLSYLPKRNPMDNNPLKQYFRQPAIFIQLPSQGKFYKDGALVLTANGEYPVLPMTTLDEITYRTPDALFNGTAVANVIESCVPNIRDAWAMPGMDVDTVLIAIRIATYGHTLDITTQCPACAEEADYGVDLRTVLEKIGRPNYATPMNIGGMTIHFQPMSYRQINSNSMTQFTNQKTIQMLQDDTVEDGVKLAQMGEMLKNITAVTTNALAQNIAMVEIPGTQVVSLEHIADWLSNCDRGTYARVRDYIIENKQQGEIQPLEIKCSSCSNDYQQQFTLDMANFFEAAS